MAMSSDREKLAEATASTTSLDSRLLTDFDAAMACAAERATSAARELGQAADMGDRFAAGLRAVLEAAAADPDASQLCLVEAPGLGGRTLEHREVGLQRFVDWLQDEILASRETAAAPNLAAEMVIGGIYEVLQRKARAGELAELPAMADDLRQLWLPILGQR